MLTRGIGKIFATGFIVAVLVLSITENVSAGSIDYFEDFEDGTADGFEVVSQGWEVTDDNGNKVYHSTNFTRLARSAVGDSEWTDVCAQMKMKINGYSGPKYSSAGFLMRYIDKNNYYIVHIENDRVQIRKKVAGAGFEPLYDEPQTLEMGKWYDFKVTVIGNEIKVYLDGALVAEHVAKGAHAEALSKGKVALIQSTSDSMFDDVKITDPNASAPNPVE